MQGRRSASGSASGSVYGDRKPGIGRTPSMSSTQAPGLARQSSTSKYGMPPPPAAGLAAPAAPPPYSSGGAAGLTSSGSIKKAPPPPPPMKRGVSAANVQYCVALFDFAAQVSDERSHCLRSAEPGTHACRFALCVIQAEGDLSFSVGDRIQIIERSDSQDDWWTGKVNGLTGSFPGSYTQLE